jgi:hypothetical protein
MYGLLDNTYHKLEFNWFRHVVFPIALNSAASFRCIVLALAGANRADLSGRSTSDKLGYEQY